MVRISSGTSRRALLGGLTATSVVAFPSITSWGAAITALPFASTGEPISLRRSQEGRSLSRSRYRNAESFFVGVERGTGECGPDRLYAVGIVLQLGLSSHLLDVGFDDAWCARHIGLHIGKSLAHANATGLGHNAPDFERLAAILSPYGKWRNAGLENPTVDCPFSHQDICRLTRALLERVHQVTGHPRPRGWRKRFL